ncbi:MAG: TetR/AcrR family transcriptional regulator [Burkholderia sp.]
MHLFWEYGYEATSLSQLKAQIGGGIAAPSFYAAFGSKEALFREAAERYLATHGQVTACLWDTRLAPREALEAALRGSARMQCARSHPKGCMVALGSMSACGPDTAAALEPLLASQARTRAGIAACVERGVASGELRTDLDTRALVTVFDSFLLGITPLARNGTRHAVLDAAITSIMTMWDAARVA